MSERRPNCYLIVWEDRVLDKCDSFRGAMIRRGKHRARLLRLGAQSPIIMVYLAMEASEDNRAEIVKIFQKIRERSA